MPDGRRLSKVCNTLILMELISCQESTPGRRGQRFVSRVDIVLVKPNIGWDRTPEQANTNPDLVAELVRQCLDSGAKRVIVTDVSCNEARRCFQPSGIAAAAQNAGAEVILPDPSRFKEVDLQGEVLTRWQVFEPYLNVDKSSTSPLPSITP